MSPRRRGPVTPSRTLTERCARSIAAPLGGGGGEHQRGAGWRVDLVAVVHLDDLDVEVLVQRLGDAAGERHQQVHAEAHVAGLDDGSVAGRRGNLRLVGCGQSRGADDMHGARVGREAGELDGGLGRCEVENAVAAGDDVEGVGGDRNAERA